MAASKSRSAARQAVANDAKPAVAKGATPAVAKGAKPAVAKTAKPAVESAADRLARLSFISVFLASERLTAEVEKLCRDEHIMMSHYTVLWFLARRSEPDGVPMGTVIDGHLNHASDSTRLADRLTSLGLIERLASPNDRRVVLVRLTEAGRHAYARLTRRILELHHEQWSVLSSKELKELSRLLGKVLKSRDPSLARLLETSGGNEESPS